MTMDEAKEALLRAYQELEQAQSDVMHAQQRIRACEQRKIACEAVCHVLLSLPVEKETA